MEGLAMAMNDALGIRIQMLRKQENMSQDDLARWLDVPRSAVSQIENCERNVSRCVYGLEATGSDDRHQIQVL